MFDRPVPAEGLRFTHLISWWREGENIPADVNDREVGDALHACLRASLGDNGAELKVFDTYRPGTGRRSTSRRSSHRCTCSTPADPAPTAPFGEGDPLARQRMDFLILFSSRHRVVFTGCVPL